MVTSLSEFFPNSTVGFSVFDQLSYFDRSLPFGQVLSAHRVREMFADSDVLFGYGENDFWNTGLTLWAFVGQVLHDGKHVKLVDGFTFTMPDTPENQAEFPQAKTQALGVDVCMRLHQLRKVDHSKVRWLGPNDYIDIWRRPQRARWMSPGLYD